MLTYYSFSALLNAATSLFVGLFVLITKGKSKLARHFAFYALAVALWSTPYFFWQLTEQADEALFLGRLLMVGAIIIPSTLLHFSVILSGIDQQKHIKQLLRVSYLLMIIWLLFDATPFFFSGVTPKGPFPYFFDIGIAYHGYMLSYIIQMSLSLWFLVQARKEATGKRRKQITLFLAGSTIAIVTGATNFLLLYNIPIPPIGNIFVSVYIVFILYAMNRYQFLDLKIIWAEILSLLLLLIFLIKIVFFSSGNINLLADVSIFLLSVTITGFLLWSVRKNAKIQREYDLLEEIDKHKSSFIHIAGHHLRTPLAAITGYIELVREGAFGGRHPMMEEAIHAIEKNADRMTRLVNEFLIITNIEQQRKTTWFRNYALCKNIKQVIEELQEKADKKSLTIAWDCPEEDIYLVMDEEHINQVIYNFLENAICYSARGTISIYVDEERKQGKLGVSVRVIDQGIGFEHADQVQFFQKFYRGKNVATRNVNYGAGISMYVAKRFIELHHGEIWAKSEGLRKGAEFGFWIPFGLPEKR